LYLGSTLKPEFGSKGQVCH